jgi:CsoR family transcriptional regulator, copper-sensing transcriptional repressor
MHGYTQNKDDYLMRLRRIEGQVRGLQRMVESDKYCIDILTQGRGRDQGAAVGGARPA